MNILTVGTFDLPHYGHHRLLKRCKDFGDVYVGINTDEFVKKYKGVAPILSYKERAETVREWGYMTLPNDQKDGSIRPLVEQCWPQIIAIGSDWLRKPYLEQIGLTIDYLEDKKIGLLYLPYTIDISATQIKERVRKQLL